MMNLSVLFVLAALSASPSCVDAFLGTSGRSTAFTSTSPATKTSLFARTASRKEFLTNVISGAVIGLASSWPVSAMDTIEQISTTTSTSTTNIASSSSVNIAAEIKTLDFSLPSYNDLSDAKASVQNVDGLAVEPLQKEEKAAPVSAPKKKREKKTASSPSSPDMTSVFPSMGKVSAEDKKKLQAKKVAAKAASKAEREEKAAAIAAAKEEREDKAAAITAVDMSLPSYSDSTTTKDKSVFAL